MRDLMTKLSRTLVSGLFLASGTLAAQSAIKPGSDAPACAECSHRAVLVTQLGADNPDGPDFSIFTRVSRQSSGRYIAGPVNEMKDIAVFSANGKFERMLGRQGAGPGEFRSPVNCGVTPGDYTTARAKFPGSMAYVLGDGHFSSMTSNDDGMVAINVWKLLPK